MVCIYCEGRTSVFNSRHQKRHNSIWRRRKCIKCLAVFTSIEEVDFEKSILVNNHGQYKPFLRDKLFAGIYDSLKHRKTALSDATALTDTIISAITPLARKGSIDIIDIKSKCSETLTRFDKTAGVYYSAYHP